MVIRDRNQAIQPPQLGFDARLFRRYDVFLLLSWVFTSMLDYVVLLFSLSDFALSIRLWYTQATDLVGFLNIGAALGRPIIGILSDRCNRIDTAGALTLLCGLSCLAFWVPAMSYGLTMFFILICGEIVGVFWMVSCPSDRTQVISCTVANGLVMGSDYKSALCGNCRTQGSPVPLIAIMGHGYHIDQK
jgi:predicted MFS family arabinose efflux permease